MLQPDPGSPILEMVRERFDEPCVTAQRYDRAKNWMEVMSKSTTNGIIALAQANYSDWCVPPENLTPPANETSIGKVAPASWRILAGTLFLFWWTATDCAATNLKNPS